MEALYTDFNNLIRIKIRGIDGCKTETKRINPYKITIIRENGKMAGRPEAHIDWNKVDQLLEAGCPGTEISAYFGVHADTLYNRCRTDKNSDFSDYAQKKRSRGDSLLRAKQYQVAMEGDRSMLIWLGKNRLEQKDQTEVSASLTVNTINYADANIPDDTPQVSAEELSAQGDESPGSGD